MTKRPTPTTPQPANLTPDEMKRGITRFQKRIAALEDFEASSVTSQFVPEVDALKAYIDDALVSTFGNDTVEYKRYRSAAFLSAGAISMVGETPLYEVRSELEASKASSIALLRQASASLQERLEELGESPSAKALQAIDGLDLHPQIDRAAIQLYRDGHYANAVQDACKALKLMVQLHSGRDDLDGVPLMQAVFSPKSPILAFNALKSQTDTDEQQGLMFLFAGVMSAFRNPRAHDFVEDDPERAIEVIGFVSLLAKLLEKAKRT